MSATDKLNFGAASIIRKIARANGTDRKLTFDGYVHDALGACPSGEPCPACLVFEVEEFVRRQRDQEHEALRQHVESMERIRKAQQQRVAQRRQARAGRPAVSKLPATVTVPAAGLTKASIWTDPLRFAAELRALGQAVTCQCAGPSCMCRASESGSSAGRIGAGRRSNVNGRST